MNKVKQFLFWIKNNIELVVILIASAVLRIVHLGYSDFQGDEIKALYLPAADEKWYEFLLTQRKGPVQFLVTFLIKFFDPNYVNQFLVRLPFAIAGTLAVVFFYLLIKRLLNKKVAFYAALLMASNGFFIAFSRIAQYQSFVILFSILAVYYLHLASTDERFTIKGLYLAALYWAISILSHYDGFFIAPIMLYLFINWTKNKTYTPKTKVLSTFKAAGLFLTLNLLFYIPFALFITQNTTEYWLGRLSGDVSDKISSSYYLFTVYQPIYAIHFYVGFLVLGILLILLLLPKFTRKLVSISSEIPFGNLIAIVSWFLLPFIFWEFVVYISGTHIYTYILPAFVIVALGIVFIEKIWISVTSKIRFIKPMLILRVSIGLFFVFLFAQAYAIFVDNYREYPWQEEKFFIWTFPVPTPAYHLSMFGFPYYRNWEGIGDFIKPFDDVAAYSTNERESISRQYIHLAKDTDLAGFYVYILFPQSFTNTLVNEKVLYWASKYPPVYTMSRNGQDLVNVYLMTPGTVEDLRLQGL